MADDKRVANRKLQEMLMYLHRHRRDMAAYRDKGDTAGVERCEQALKIADSLIRKYCAEQGLELPHDVSPADTE